MDPAIIPEYSEPGMKIDFRHRSPSTRKRGAIGRYRGSMPAIHFGFPNRRLGKEWFRCRSDPSNDDAFPAAISNPRISIISMNREADRSSCPVI